MQDDRGSSDRREAVAAEFGGGGRWGALPSARAKTTEGSGRFANETAPTLRPFQSILFPSSLPGPDHRQGVQPACFTDLNLDQVFDAVVAKRDAAVLRPIFNTTHRSESVIRYRQAIFADLECEELVRPFPPFCNAMRTVRANLAYADTIDRRSHRNTVILRAAAAYCEAVEALLQGLRSASPRSAGLCGLRDYLAAYVISPGFIGLSADTCRLREELLGVNYGVLFRGDKATVRRYASEPDYTLTIRERFARFRETPATPAAPPKEQDDFSLNHIEAAILDFVERLFPGPFRALGDFVEQHARFIDEVVARSDREVGFYVAFLAYIEPLKAAGLPFCYPNVSACEKDTEVRDGFDLALAAKLVREKRPIVCNSFALSGAERLIVVTGPNQGGKTTFARMFGQAHVLAGLGCPVPGREARLFLPDQVFTHFERSEDIANLRGKLEDELIRLHQSCQAMTSSSVVVLNEVFNSTSLDDQIFLSTKILEQIIATGSVGICVTFIDGLSKLNEKTVSMVSTVAPDDPASRTFVILRKPADGLAYALSLAERRGVTEDKLRARIRP